MVRRNVHVRAEAGSPQADSVKVSYTDSVIKALPIKSEKDNGQQVLIDLADLFMTDLADIGIQSRPGAQHLGEGEGISEERRDRGQRGLLHAPATGGPTFSATTFPTPAARRW